jgi:inner membrane transporter RhtA
VAATETALVRPGPLTRAPSGGLVIGAMVSVQLGAALATTLFSGIGPAGTVLLRLCSAAIVLSIVGRPSVRGRTRRELGLAALFGLILAAMNLRFYESIDRIPLGISVTLEFVGPLTVALVGSRSRLDLLWVGLAAVGIVALARGGGGHGLNGLGVALALIAGGLWGTYIIVNARLGKAFAGASGLSISMCVAALVMIPVGLGINGGSHLLEPQYLFQGAAVGVLSSAIPYAFEMEALRRIAPSVFGVLMSLEPAVAALAGLAVLGQQLAAREIVGMALVTAASIGAARRARESPVEV